MTSGEKFGRLISVRFSHRGKCREHYWVFCCDCGVEKVISTKKVVSGKTKSCGCLRRETAAILGRSNSVHGMYGTPEYHAWRSMIKRCYNPSHKSFSYYGGRGIKVCYLWRKSFSIFLADVGMRPLSKHTIDRIDNYGNYELGNVRWATYTEQARNRRSNTMYQFHGQMLALSEIAEYLQVKTCTLWRRIKHGMPLDRAFARGDLRSARCELIPRLPLTPAAARAIGFSGLAPVTISVVN